MQFKYTATNTDGKKLTGVINADDETGARAQLNNLGFSILEVKPMEASAEPQANSKLEKFEFEAIDKNGKKVKGTIPAKSAFLVYKRLTEEYHFNITYIAPANADESTKSNMRGTGLNELRQQYEAEINETKTQQDENMNRIAESPEFLQKKEQLLKQVDVITNKIKTLLANYESSISPDKKAEIHGHLEKLLRIKSSNNLEYISNTCKELLDTIQKEETFLQSQNHDKERSNVMLESQKMMMDLNKSMNQKTDLGNQLKNSVNQLEAKLQGSKLEFLLNPLNTIKHWFETPAELAPIKTQLKALRDQKIDAFKLAIKSPKETRADAWAQLKKIMAQERAVKEKQKTIKSMRHQQRKLKDQEKRLYFTEELNVFSGWLLGFYLTYYFIGFYVTQKGWGIEPWLGIPFDLSESVLFKYLLAITFFIHATTSLKMNFFVRHRFATPILVGTSCLLSLLTIFNF